MRDIVCRDCGAAVWIGASKADGSWKWMDGSPLTWSPPDVDWSRDGTSLFYAGGNWFPQDSSTSIYYMCAIKIKTCDAATDKVLRSI